MRLRRSVALVKADQLVFAAICSAADTIKVSLSCKRRPERFPGSGGAFGKLSAYVSSLNAAYNSYSAACAEVTESEPPAFSTASTADFDAPVT